MVNIDDLPISAPKAKNFEELLESNLRQMGMDPQPLLDDSRMGGDGEDFGGRPKPKREFLKRKSKKAEVPPTAPNKRYNYYADNFEGEKKSEEPRAAAPHHKSGGNDHGAGSFGG